jgi:membrane-associated protease RseP (regulator of RpoE activity)
MSDPTGSLTSTPEYPHPVQVWVARAPKQRYWIHALLLVLTVFTTLVVGARMQDNFAHNQSVFASGDDGLSFFPVTWVFAQPSRLLLGLPFSAALMLILLAHEMGHYVYCKRYGVLATLPFFIPAPSLFGTLGAFIRIRAPIRFRAALFDIGIAGPIAGFVVAIGVLAVSLGLSKPLSAPIPPDGIQLGYPLVFELVHRLLAALAPGFGGIALPLKDANLHPTAVAAWVGMFATSLNLLPGGQLDGGHIVFSMAPRAHRIVSRLTILILIPMAVYLWDGWLVWAVLLELSSMRHPQVTEWPRVSGGRSWLAGFALVMLVLTLTPAPIAHNSLKQVVRELRAGR